MGKLTSTWITVVAAVSAAALPTLVGMYLARLHSEDVEKHRVLAYARDVVLRSDIGSNQIAIGIDRLMRANQGDPCSAAQLALMREIDLASSYVQAIGYVSGTKMVCSSLGKGPDEQFELGSPDVLASTGNIIRTNVVLPLSTPTSFIVVERHHYAAIVHKDLTIDISAAEPDLSLATLTADNRQIRSEHGTIQPQWLDALGTQREVTFVDDHNVVAIVRSEKYSTIAVAALPIKYLHANVQSTAIWLIPLSVLMSGGLICILLYVVRLQSAMPAVLRAALRRKEFFLVYEPIVDLQTRQWVGAEALIRWRQSTGELVRPDLFIPVAEETGLIHAVTEHVIGLVRDDAADLFRRHPEFCVSINLSAADLQSPRTLELLQWLARKTGAGNGNLCVEATERGLMDADVARPMLKTLRERGIRVSIDDFGTGYSSLSYLETFEIDFLKIDKSFVDKIGTQAATSQLALHIIEMAKSLGLRMIAEGVETEAQAQLLAERGVHYAQGWLFTKPLRFAELRAMIEAQQRMQSQ